MDNLLRPEPVSPVHPAAPTPAASLPGAGAPAAVLSADVGVVQVISDPTEAVRERSVASTLDPVLGLAAFASAVDRRRQAYGWLVAITLLPALTVLATEGRSRLSLTDDLLIYLVAVVAVAVV